MNEEVKKDILKILKEIIEILKVPEPSDVIELKMLSNTTIHDASIFQDQDSVSLAVITYSISKILERKKFIEDKTISTIKDAHAHLQNNEIEKYNKSIKVLFKQISSIDQKIGMYIDKVITQAQIKKGTKIYDHGISLAQA